MKKTIWLISVVLLSTNILFGQGTIIEPPTLESVSVNPITGKVTIRWKPSLTPNINGYLIYEYVGGGIAGINEKCVNNPYRTDTTFEYPDVTNRPVKFIIAAFKGVCGNNPNRSMYDEIHKTIYASLTYDSCKSEIKINWTKYQGWGDSLARYKVFQIKNDTTAINISGDLSPNDSSYTISNIQGNQNYCYYVAAEHTGNISVTSNMSCHKTFLNDLPNYILADQAVFLSNNLVELQFTLDPNSQTKNYQLTGADSRDGEFSAIKQFYNVQGDQLLVVDTLKNIAPKYYRLEALNSCNIGVKFSNKTTAMVPITSVGINEIALVWNDYQDWPQGINEYQIFRSIGESGFQRLNAQSGSITGYTDNIASLVGQQLSGNICYYVEAISNNSSAGKTYQSRSATVCVDITANVFIPDAFTPNDDGQNDEFKPSFAFLPSNYKLTIFNRNGFKIYESSDPMKGWDGKLANHEKAPEGVYVYFIKFTSGNGKTVEKKGNFSLIYP